MNDLKAFARKLRQAADLLEDLFGNGGPGAPDNEHPQAAAKILATLRGRKKHPGYNGKHWTQRPGNKAKLKKMAQKSAATRLKNQVTE